jgi:hypothetical protein
MMMGHPGGGAAAANSSSMLLMMGGGAGPSSSSSSFLSSSGVGGGGHGGGTVGMMDWTSDKKLSQLADEREHERLTKTQKSKLLQKNLESLRGLVKDIESDHWMYANNNNHNGNSHSGSNYVTTSASWKRPRSPST